MSFKSIYTPDAKKPMYVVFFASGGPGNIQCAFETEASSKGLFHIGLVITDRPNIPAIDVAKKYKRPCFEYNFDEICGKYTVQKQKSSSLEKYLICREKLHDIILFDIQKYEQKNNINFDLAVLAYRRIITGKLYTYFEDRMINQHPADLSILTDYPPFKRKYIGIEGLDNSLKEGNKSTRTSTILVKEGIDDGEILCQGPWISFIGTPLNPVDISTHEINQKKLSDWPSLSFALLEIAKGSFDICLDKTHKDGTRVVRYQGKELSYAGINIE